MEKNLDQMYKELKALLIKYNKSPLFGQGTVWGSKTKPEKDSFHLYGEKEVAILKRKPQPTYFAGIIHQKRFIGLYVMPIYSHLKQIKIETSELKKFLKGKSCFNVTYITPGVLKDIEGVLKQGLALYKKEGWI